MQNDVFSPYADSETQKCTTWEGFAQEARAAWRRARGHPLLDCQIRRFVHLVRIVRISGPTRCFVSYAAISASCCRVSPMSSKPFSKQWRENSSIAKVAANDFSSFT